MIPPTQPLRTQAALKNAREAARLSRRADILVDRRKYAEALEACRQALALDPARPDLYRRIGGLAVLLKQPGIACEALGIAVALDPADTASLCNLGAALRAAGRAEEAAQPLEAALRLDPANASAWFNLGVVLADMARWEQAASCHGRALHVAPGHAKAAGGLAMALLAMGRPAQSAAVARHALLGAPDFAELHICLGQALLEQGRLAEGWAEDDWRWRVADGAPKLRHAGTPMWRGEALAGRRLLIHAEQGFGDTLQMARYLARIVGAGAIVFEVQLPLLRLCATLARPASMPVDIVAWDDPLPPCDVQCPVMSLAFACGTAVPADVPATVPYLGAAAADMAIWRGRLAGLKGLRVGLCWAAGHRPDLVGALLQARKSLPLAALAPLADIGGCDFVSLQTGPAAAEAAAGALLIQDVSAGLRDFADTAALIACLDLVISVDTAVAHLAGALGAPIWLLNRFDADWRWSAAQEMAQEAAPWYPTLRQFRQKAPGAWGHVIADVADALSELARQPRPAVR